MITLNQVVELLQNFQIKHKVLKTFYFGDEWEVGASSPIQYPLMWASLINSKYDIKTGVATRTIQVDISDLVNRDESNEASVLSDCELISYDLLNYIDQIADSADFNIRISDQSTLNNYTEKRDDMASGWYFTFDIITSIDTMSCQLPVNSGAIFSGNYIYINGNVLSSTCAPVLIKDQYGNILSIVPSNGTYIVEVLTEEDYIITGNTLTLSRVPTGVFFGFLEGVKCQVGTGFRILSIVGNLVTFDADYTGQNFAAVY